MSKRTITDAHWLALIDWMRKGREILEPLTVPNLARSANTHFDFDVTPSAARRARKALNWSETRQGGGGKRSEHGHARMVGTRVAIVLERLIVDNDLKVDSEVHSIIQNLRDWGAGRGPLEPLN